MFSKVFEISSAQLIVFAGPPETMRNCIVKNHTVDSFVVHCEPGYDGGLAQTFHLKLYSSNNEFLRGNMTAQENPTFLVEDLVKGTSFILVLYASNAKGRSKYVKLVANTLMPAERHTGKQISFLSNCVIPHDLMFHVLYRPHKLCKNP